MHSTPGICIAICGRYGSGKDAIADILCRDFDFVNHKFARPLKTAVKNLFGLEPDHVDGPLKDVVHPKWGVTPRKILQWFGTEVMQHGLCSIAPDAGRTFWSEHLRNELCGNCQKVVVSDLRFAHELDMLRDLYSDRLLTIRVIRHFGPGIGDPHESEAGVSDLNVDMDIYNTGTLEDLKSAILSNKVLSRIIHVNKG